MRTVKKKTIRREYLKILRKDKGITAAEMAGMIGLSCRQHYLRYENGERDLGKKGRISYFSKFSRIFCLPIYFFEQAEDDYLKAKEDYNALNHS